MRIDEALLNEAKALAAKQGRSLNSVMEDALRELLNRSTLVERERIELPEFVGEVGYQPWVEVRLAAGEGIEHIVHDLADEEWMEAAARDAAL
ncbi:hypothetical protein [Nonomuraea sp. NPDC046570]|uniref:hypothetical protein n=1 Tax=Nonomuraea sp. NPDC046570 TaxID=3155255 RepID=UPI0033C1A0AF